MIYQIRIEGHLGDQWTDWFDGLIITLVDNGDTLLTGPVVDQAGKQRLAAGAIMDDATLGKMDYFVQGVSSRLPNAK